MERRHFIKKLSLAAAGACALSGVGSLAYALPKDGSAIHVVRSGETLSHIARRYGVTVASLKQANGLTGDLIRINQRLNIPGRGGSFLTPVRPQIDVAGFSAGRWRHIIVHHSATGNGNAEIFHRFHRDHRNMPNGLGYHFIIGNGTNSRDGEIEVGTRWTRQIQGGHVRSLAYNANSIGICLVGNFETGRPTANQMASFTELVHYLKETKLGGSCRLLAHKELETTLCPGRHFPLREMHQRFG